MTEQQEPPVAPPEQVVAAALGTELRATMRKTDWAGSWADRVRRLLYHSPMSAAEFIVGVAPFCWGLRLLCGGVYETSASWNVFAHYTNERVVGATMMITGLVQMLAVISPQASYYHRLHYAFALWHLVAWAASGVLFLFANPGGVLWIDALAVVLPQFWVVMRLGHTPRPRPDEADTWAEDRPSLPDAL